MGKIIELYTLGKKIEMHFNTFRRAIIVVKISAVIYLRNTAAKNVTTRYLERKKKPRLINIIGFYADVK